MSTNYEGGTTVQIVLMLYIPWSGLSVVTMQLRIYVNIIPKQGDNKTGPSNPTNGVPGEHIWIDNVEAPARAKTLRGENNHTLVQCIRLNQERD